MNYRCWRHIFVLLYTCVVTNSLRAAPDIQGLTFFSPRSQSSNTARLLAGWHNHVYNVQPFPPQQWHIATTPYFAHAFRLDRLALALFGTTQLSIAGSQVTDRSENALVADDFGLSPMFESQVRIKPRIKTFLNFFDIAYTTQIRCTTVSAHLNIPVGWTRWGIDLQEVINPQNSTAAFPPGYMNNQLTPLRPPFTSFTQAIASGAPFGALTQGPQNGRIVSHHDAVGFADTTLFLGWHPWQIPTAHIGLQLVITAPTGNRPKGKKLFEPILGNGKHWQLGIGLHAHTSVWEDIEQELAVHTYITACHIFKARQTRTFDLFDNGFASRYLLLKVFEQEDNQDFTSTIMPAVNVTTLPCKVHNNIVVDGSLMLAYTHRNFVGNVGYNGWIRSKEIITLKEGIAQNTFGIKGVQNVIDPLTGLPDNATESSATITNGIFAQQQQRADFTPVFISTNDINIKSAASPLLITHKIFAYAGYSHEIVTYQAAPFIGIGSEVEFEGVDNRDVDHPDHIPLSLWSIFIKAGVTF